MEFRRTFTRSAQKEKESIEKIENRNKTLKNCLLKFTFRRYNNYCLDGQDKFFQF